MPAAQCALPMRALYTQHSSMFRRPAAHGCEQAPGRTLASQEGLILRILGFRGFKRIGGKGLHVGWRAQVLKKGKPEDVVDIDNALCRESMDVIGAHAPACSCAELQVLDISRGPHPQKLTKC